MVELLVVIAIIGILVALLLPAVQSAREAARRMQCANNLKQIGLGCLNYESSNGALPAGVVGKERFQDDDSPGNKQETGMGWGVAILPYIEQQPLYDQFDFSGTKHYNSTEINASGVSNHQAAQQEVLEYICPDDEFIVPFDAHNNDWAASSYRAVSGVIDESVGGLTWWDRLTSGANPIAARKEFNRFRGPLVAVSDRMSSKPVRIGQIIDGTTKTVLVGEYVQIEQSDRQNAWASGWRYHSKGHLIRDKDLEVELYRVPNTNWCAETNRGGSGGGGGNPNLCFRSFTSVHAGGIAQFVYCDGSVRGVPEGVDGDVYLSLGTIAGEEVESYDF